VAAGEGVLHPLKIFYKLKKWHQKSEKKKKKKKKNKKKKKKNFLKKKNIFIFV
jgi:hypothetical protein